MISTVRRLVPLLVLFLLAGCAGGPPEVTFAAAGTSVTAGPTQYCADDFVTCTNDAEAPVDLAVPPGTALEVTVPDAVAATPWQIVYSYRDAAGTPVDERTRVQIDAAAFTLTLPPDARLVTAEVQQFGPAPQIDPATGELTFPTRATWVLTTSP